MADSTKGRISLKGMVFRGHHGVLPAERELGQPFEVDVDLYCDLTRAVETDDITDAVDYRKVWEIARETVEDEQYHLLEALAAGLADQLMAEFQPEWVVVRVRKPHVGLPGPVATAEVEVSRSR